MFTHLRNEICRVVKTDFRNLYNQHTLIASGLKISTSYTCFFLFVLFFARGGKVCACVCVCVGVGGGKGGVDGLKIHTAHLDA